MTRLYWFSAEHFTRLLDITESIVYGVGIFEDTPILDGQRKFRIQRHGRAVSGHHRTDADATYSVYIESHLGGGAIMKRKPAVQRSIGIDIDVRAIRQFRRESPVEAK